MRHSAAGIRQIRPCPVSPAADLDGESGIVVMIGGAEEVRQQNVNEGEDKTHIAALTLRPDGMRTPGFLGQRQTRLR